jgi:hypothetical protein
MEAGALSLLRIPGTSKRESKVSQKFAFLSFLDYLTIRKINNLRVFNTLYEFHSHSLPLPELALS